MIIKNFIIKNRLSRPQKNCMKSTQEDAQVAKETTGLYVDTEMMKTWI